MNPTTDDNPNEVTTVVEDNVQNIPSPLVEASSCISVDLAQRKNRSSYDDDDYSNVYEDSAVRHAVGVPEASDDECIIEDHDLHVLSEQGFHDEEDDTECSMSEDMFNSISNEDIPDFKDIPDEMLENIANEKTYDEGVTFITKPKMITLNGADEIRAYKNRLQRKKYKERKELHLNTEKLRFVEKFGRYLRPKKK